MDTTLAFPTLDLQRAVPLGPLTTYKIGGPADLLVVVRTKDELAAAVETARREGVPYFLLGTGANILVGDRGFRGLVILNRAAHATIAGDHLTVESGATIANLIDLTARAGLSGLEHFAGIPSSVGGAIWQNLHFLAPDRVRTLFIEEIVESAEILDAANQRRTVDRAFFEFGYDDSILHHQEIVVLEVTFRLTPAPEAAIRHQAAENLAWRAARQPPVEQFPSCGSVFKKIEGVGAGRLIDQVGLKGRQIGGAQISPKHANFIVNVGGATARDVLALARLAQAEVARHTGYALQMEIGLVGEFAPDDGESVSLDVRLRKVVPGDLPIFFEHQRDPIACAMAGFPSRERDEFMAHWERVLADPGITTRTILVDEQPAGNIVSFPVDGVSEVGYWLGREHWGRGIATRALSAFLGEQRTRPLYAHVARENRASRRVLTRCGFVPTSDLSAAAGEIVYVLASPALADVPPR